MLAFPSFLAPAILAARALNALLKREPWARERLARYSGRTVRLVVGAMKLGFTLKASGYVDAADPVIVPDVTLTLTQDRLGELPAALRAGDPALIAAMMHVQGDAGLARLVSDLAGELRWDLEDELAGAVGDIAAMRLLGLGRATFGGARAAGAHLADNVGEFLAHESGALLSRPVYEGWRLKMQEMTQRLNALESRIPPSRGHGA